MPSSRPKRSAIAATAFARSSSERTSPATARTSAPISSIAAVTSASASGVRACTTTLAPTRARCSATPRPMPRDDPVTQTTLPETSKPALIGRWYVGANARDARTDAGGRGAPLPRRDLHDRELGERADERRHGRSAAPGRDRTSGPPLPRPARRRRHARRGHLRALPRRVGRGGASGRVPLGSARAAAGRRDLPDVGRVPGRRAQARPARWADGHRHVRDRAARRVGQADGRGDRQLDLPPEHRLMEVTVGTPLPPWSPGPVSPEKMKIFAAIARDPNPIHWDRAAVAERGLGDRLINQGPLNLGYVVNMLLTWTGPASLRDVTVRFTSNVFDGDEVNAGGVVTGIRVEQGTRLADCDVWLDRGDGTRVIAGTATVALPG